MLPLSSQFPQLPATTVLPDLEAGVSEQQKNNRTGDMCRTSLMMTGHARPARLSTDTIIYRDVFLHHIRTHAEQVPASLLERR